MHHRPLGRTGIPVSEIGFGAWGIGGWREGQLSYGPLSEHRAAAALNAALDAGITFFDTSPLYGEGRSEQRLGQALQGMREQIVIASKVGLAEFSAQADFSPVAMTRSLEGSLERLGTSYLDLLQLHDPDIDLLRRHPEVRETLESFQQAGTIRSYGISVRSPVDGLVAIRELAFPVVQVNFNMLDLRALDCDLFDTARQAKAGIIVRTPLCFGFLGGQFEEGVSFPPHDHRSRWDQAQTSRWVQGARAVLDAARNAGAVGDDAELALRFCLAFDAVSTVIAGPLDAAQARANASASHSRALDAETCARVEAVYRGLDIYG